MGGQGDRVPARAAGDAEEPYGGLVALPRGRVRRHGERTADVFLDDGEPESGRLCYAGLERSAWRLSSIRSGLSTFTPTNTVKVYNRLSLIWGVAPFYHEAAATTEPILKDGDKTLLEVGALEKGETIVMMAGRLSGFGLSSSVIVRTIGEDTPRR